MASTFQYTVDADGTFPNKKVNIEHLDLEIRESQINVALNSVMMVGPNCVISFRSDLAESEVGLLEAIVFNHTGAPLPVQPMPVIIYSDGTPTPTAADGKPFTLPNIFPGEVLLNFAGVDDSPTSRFNGNVFGLQQVGVGDAVFTMNFTDGFFMAGGHVSWDGGGFGSYIEMEIIAPASTTSNPAVANTGNCTLVQTGVPGLNIIVPAAGNGAKSILAPVPVPSYHDESMVLNGYWTYTEPWIGNGQVTPGVPGSSKYNLFDQPIALAHLCLIHAMKDDGERELIAPAIKPKWILPEWKLRVTLHNADASKTLRASWDLMLARRKSV